MCQIDITKLYDQVFTEWNCLVYGVQFGFGYFQYFQDIVYHLTLFVNILHNMFHCHSYKRKDILELLQCATG